MESPTDCKIPTDTSMDIVYRYIPERFGTVHFEWYYSLCSLRMESPTVNIHRNFLESFGTIHFSIELLIIVYYRHNH